MKSSNRQRLQRIVFALLLCVYGTLLAQKPNLYNFSIPQGLPSAEVYSVCQDHHGFIWFATDNGVARFDGNEIENFNTSNGLVDPVVFGFFEDTLERLWFRTYSGSLSYFKDGKIFSYPYNEKLLKLVSNSIVNSVYVDEDDLWIASGGIIGKIDRWGKENFDSVSFQELHCRRVGSQVLLGSYGISGRIKTVKIDNAEFAVELSDTITHNPVISAVYWKNELFIGINNDIFRLQEKKMKKVFTGRGQIINLTIDKKENLWIGYKKAGVDRYSNDQFLEPFDLSQLNQQSVTDVLEDNEGGIWLTTLESGVFYISDLNIKFFSIDLHSKITTVARKANPIIAGTQDGAINFYNDKKEIVKKMIIGEGPILSLHKDKRNRVWTAAKNTYLLGSTAHHQQKVFKYSSIAFGENSDYLWTIGGLRLTKHSPEGEILKINFTQSIHRLLFIEDSLIYATQRIGLDIYNMEGELVSQPKILSKYKITHIESLNDSTLLIATIGSGVLLLDKKTHLLDQYNLTNNFIINNVYSCILNDSSLWLGTEKGIVKIRRNSLAKRDIVFKQLTQKGGLRADKINIIALTENEILAFSDEGLTAVPLNFFYKPSTPPVFYLKKFLINNEEAPLQKTYILPYHKNNIELRIGYIGFNHQTVSCRYKLFDEDTWKYSASRTIQLSSLSDGDYLMHLEYTSDNHLWLNSGLDLKISIQPPLWETWYFSAGLIAIAFGLGYVILWIRENEKRDHINQLYLHQQKLLNIEIDTLETERSRISKDLHDGIGTGLVVLKMKIYKFISSSSPTVADEVEHQFQDTIGEIRKIIFELTPPGLEKYGLLNTLQAYIEKIKKDTDIEIEFYSTGPEYEEKGKTILAFRIIQELISNSLKHSQANKITLHVNSFEEEMNIIYEDNGIGFAIDSKKKGHGLHNIESRIKALKGSMQADSGNFGVSFIFTIPKS
jgi:signal transduction histidine kinase